VVCALGVSAVITMKVQTDATQVKLPLWIHLVETRLFHMSDISERLLAAASCTCVSASRASIGVTAAALSACALVVVSTLAVIFRQRRPYFGDGSGSWNASTMIGLVQVGVQAMADRYAYIPMLGIFVIVCWGAADLMESWHIPTAVVSRRHCGHSAGAGNCASSAGEFLD